MASETKLWLVAVFLLSATNIQQHYIVAGNPQVPCLFIFGDSLSDCGNNNNLKTDAKANHPPYGIDFPNGPTGRFTNGRTSVDVLTELLGFDAYIPPFANTTVSDIMKGVNYASASSGILYETGMNWGEHFSLKMQMEKHIGIVSKIIMKLRNSDEAKEHLSKCLYYVNTGSNDYINNYFLPDHYNSSQTFSTDEFAEALIKEYSKNLMDLRSLGARKFALIGLLPVGCIPGEISTHGKPGSLCVKEENDAVVPFNDKLKSLVDRFNEQFPDCKFIFINTVEAILAGMTKNVQDVNAGLDVFSCCKVGSNGLCIPNENPCYNRNVRPFFDSYHPSEVTNEAIAAIAYNDVSTKAAYPMDISHLVKL
ncbi:GDSL esterase/lipase At4g18970-like [Vigna radiata var. radiata]|uniref:GDSL esterase/lipase At4g18970-like n=1 Tax=Vigna radiata var. radiata TaxID=3916 RepID=A0A3Q0F573_VIGRR|nr:GDSL esterase/lipase At4g18970-like [Vigna radiata var. radiata]